MAGEIAVALINLLGGGAQGFAQSKERGRREETETLLAVEEILDRRKSRKEARAGQIEDREDTQQFQFEEGERNRAAEAGEREKDRTFKKEDREDTQLFESGENTLNRALQELGIKTQDRTARAVASIREQDDATDPNLFINKAVMEAYMEALKNPATAQNALPIAKEAFMTFRDMVNREGFFGPQANLAPEPDSVLNNSSFLDAMFRDTGEPAGVDLTKIGIPFMTPSLKKYRAKKQPGTRTLQ